jgi:lysophospholipase L1-like esterase
MSLLPSEIPTGLVTGQFYFVSEDNVDGDIDPSLTVVDGTVTFKCSASVLRMPTKTVTVIPLEFKAKFNTAGQLVSAEDPNVGLELPATNSSLFNPTGFTWKVTFDLVQLPGRTTVQIPSFDIQVPEGVTTDLTTAMPVSTSPGTITVQGPQGNIGPTGATGAAGDGAYIQQVPRIANYLTREEKIGSYKTLLQNAGSTVVNIIACGDSITEGTGSTNTDNRWQTLLNTNLRYRHGVAPGAKYPFIPTWPKTSAPGIPVTRTGNVTADTSRGLGWKAGIVGDTGVVTFTFTGTSAKLLFFKGTTTGQMQVSIDGGAAVTVDTNSTTNPPAANVGVWASPALTAGVHTVQVTRAASSANSIYLNGCLTYNGDETTGIRVLDAAYHGTASTWLYASHMDQLVSNITTIGNVGLVLLNIGTNDYTANDIVGYKANIALFVSKLRDGGYTGSIVLMNAYKGLAGTALRDEAQWAQFGNAMREVAATDSKVAYFDWRMRMVDVPAPYNASSSLGLFADGLHPSDAGNQYIASIMTDYLSDRA